MKRCKRTISMFSERVLTVYRSGPLKGLPKYPEDGMKRCVRCRETWTLDDYHRDPKQPDGRRNECKACRKEATEKRKPKPPQLELFR